MAVKSPKTYWTAASTKNSQERRAAHHVEKQDFQYYIPEMLVLSSSGRERVELLFPGYIFVKIKKNWESLCSTRGISRLFMCDGSPTRIPDNQIEYFKSREDDQGYVLLDPPLETGVRVVGNDHAGSYVGISGVVQRMTARDRVAVLLSLLGRRVEVDMDRRALDAM